MLHFICIDTDRQVNSSSLAARRNLGRLRVPGRSVFVLSETCGWWLFCLLDVASKLCGVEKGSEALLRRGRGWTCVLSVRHSEDDGDGCGGALGWR